MTEEPDNPFDVRLLDPRAVRLFRTDPADALVRLTLEGERSWRSVQIARAFPFSDPEHYIGLRDSEGGDIGLLPTLDGLDDTSRAVVDAELERRYFVPQVQRVLFVSEAQGVVTWDLETDRGPRHVVIRNLRDSVQSLGPSRLLLTDSDGNRYEFPDVNAYGAKAYAVLAKVT